MILLVGNQLPFCLGSCLWHNSGGCWYHRWGCSGGTMHRMGSWGCSNKGLTSSSVSMACLNQIWTTCKDANPQTETDRKEYIQHRARKTCASKGFVSFCKWWMHHCCFFFVTHLSERSIIWSVKFNIPQACHVLCIYFNLKKITRLPCCNINLEESEGLGLGYVQKQLDCKGY